MTKVFKTKIKLEGFLGNSAINKPYSHHQSYGYPSHYSVRLYSKATQGWVYKVVQNLASEIMEFANENSIDITTTKSSMQDVVEQIITTKLFGGVHARKYQWFLKKKLNPNKHIQTVAYIKSKPDVIVDGVLTPDTLYSLYYIIKKGMILNCQVEFDVEVYFDEKHKTIDVWKSHATIILPKELNLGGHRLTSKNILATIKESSDGSELKDYESKIDDLIEELKND